VKVWFQPTLVIVGAEKKENFFRHRKETLTDFLFNKNKRHIAVELSGGDNSSGAGWIVVEINIYSYYQ